MKRILIGVALAASTCAVKAQWWDTGNLTVIPGTSFLGSINNAQLDVITNDIRRFTLLPDATYTIGSFPGQVKDGSLLLSPDVDQFYFIGAPGPYSLLHLAAGSNSAQQQSYREWMNTGISLTGNEDHAYWGLKEAELDYTDVVLHWSDNPGKGLKDRMRFIFTSGYSGVATSGANSAEGLEAMRMFPVSNTGVNIGVGDFFAGNLVDPGYVQEPTERLDVLNGRLRIRQLPEDNATEDPYLVMVVDDSPYPSAERGVVKWVDPSVFSQIDCDWTIAPGVNPGDNAVYTAVGTAVPDCPDETEGVGIGTALPTAKLDVRTDDFATGVNVSASMATATSIGLKTDASGGTTESIGLAAQSAGASPTTTGARVIAAGNGTLNRGATIVAIGPATDNRALELTCVSGTNSNSGIVAVVNSASVDNTGANYAVSGGANTNTGEDITVFGAAAINEGVVADVSGASDSNIGFDGTVSGAASTHIGERLAVSGSQETNMGEHITVTGAGLSHVGSMLQVSGSLSSNVGTDITTTGSASGWNIGLRSNQNGTTPRVRGVWATTSGATNTGYALKGEENSGTATTYSHGVNGLSLGAGAQSYGVSGSTTGNAPIACGLYGISGTQITPLLGTYGLWAGNSANSPTDFAAWMNGTTYLNGVGTGNMGMFYTSDENLKTNIEPIGNALELLGEITPSTYHFVPDAAPGMNLPEGDQAGFRAQEVEGTFPHLVRDFTFPASVDSMGAIIHPAFDYKAINYTGLIPYLVQAVQELQAKNAQLEASLNHCCSNMDGTRGAAPGASVPEEDVRIEQLVIAPNPFTTHTTVRYHIAQEGRARLEVSNGEGRVLEVLREERTMAGDHTYEWNTSDLSPGTYYVALVVDGNVIVKRAVKVGE